MKTMGMANPKALANDLAEAALVELPKALWMEVALLWNSQTRCVVPFASSKTASWSAWQ